MMNGRILSLSGNWAHPILHVFLLLLCLSVCSGLQEYNEPCELYDSSTSCNMSVGLMCLETAKGFRCKCPSDPQFATMYDTQRKKCVGKAQNSCVFSKKAAEMLCTENADCITGLYYFPVCMCKNGYYETERGTCALSAKHGDTCDEEEQQCDVKSGMTCKDNKCQCKYPEDQYYNEEENKCISYAGGNCSGENSCVPNAECRKTVVSRIIESRTVIFSPNGKQEVVDIVEKGIGLKCLCQPGFSEHNDTRQCLRTYGSVCESPKESNNSIANDTNRSIECNSQEALTCIDGHDGQFRCLCRNPLNERWDEKQRRCVALLGRHCRLDGAKCEDQAECVDNLCQCVKGTSLTPEGTCLLDLDQSCKPGQCNLYKGLTCIAETATCGCLDSYLDYDQDSHACLSPLGAPCGPINWQRGPNGMAGPTTEGPFVGCAGNATCEAKPVGRRMLHVCTASASSA